MFKRTNLRSPLLAILTVSCLGSAAQTIQSVTFKTPEVAAFNRSMEMPVSQYTGVPGISIPLYEIKINGVSVPISLDYHAGGIRIDEEATWVGLGWNLNYGGTISRKVRGAADEGYFLFGESNGSYTSVNGFQALPGWLSDPYMTQRTSKVQYAKMGTGSIYADFMPDEFSYSALGNSGKFLFSQEQKKFITYPKADVLVRDYGSNNTLTESYQNYHPLNCWNIQLADGTSVDFGKEGTVSQSLGDNANSRTAKTAWQIRAIRNNFNDSITYAYASSNYTAWRFSGEKYSYLSGNVSHTRSMSQFSFYDVRLSSITFPGGSLTCSTADRDDTPSGTKKLTELNVYNSQGTLVKKILFYYSYFYGSSFNALPSINSTLSSSIPADQQFKRLRLDSVAISGNTSKNITYKFDYHTTSELPAKISFAQDHWGYFNGMNNSTLLPPIISSSYVASGDRRVKPESSKAFTLKSITYPEGGKTEFSYESNTAGNVTNIVPGELLSIYQDDNTVNRTETISFSGVNNNNLYPAPDISNPNQLYTYKKTFTVGSGVSNYSSNGWSFSTNYGVYDMGSYLYGTGKITFKLERINSDNSRTLVQSIDANNLGNGAVSSVTDSRSLSLATGNYEMTATVYPYYGYPPPSFNNSHSTSFTISWQEAGLSNQVYTGGLRVKEVRYYNSDNSLARQKNYQYLKPVSSTDHTLSSNTSGYAVSFPQYIQGFMQHTDVYPLVLNGVSIYSNSVIPLETTAGSYSGYENVTETETDNAGTLRTDYKFSFAQPYFSAYSASYMYALIEPKEWERGKLLSKRQFKGAQVIRSEDYTYHLYSPHLGEASQEEYAQEINTDLISGKSMVPAGGGSSFGSPDFYYWPNMLAEIALGYLGNSSVFRFNYGVDDFVQDLPHQVRLPYFKRYTGFDKLQTKTVTTYDDSGNGTTQTENYYYEKTPVHYQLSRLKSSTSTGEVVKTTYTYPPDYAGISSGNALSQGIKNLADKHIFSPQVETSVYRSDANDSNTRLVSSSFTAFKAASPLPDVTYSLENPAPLGNFSPSSVQGGAVSTDSRYKPSAFYSQFDGHGNILQLQKDGGAPGSYLWGYGGLYPIAEAKNAPLAEIYHQNFEDGSDLDGNTSRDNTRSHTGLYSGKIVNGGSGEVVSHSGTWLSITPGGSATRKFLYSVWVYSGGPAADLFLFMKTPEETGYFTNVSAVTCTTAGKWTLLQGIAEVPGNISRLSLRLDNNSAGTVWYDDLRLHPAEASMSTHTYRPLVGLTSSTDARSNTSYYGYDSFQRLKTIRDQEGNLVKSYDYHYKP